MLWLMMLAAALAVNPANLKHPAIGVFIDFDAAPSEQSVDAMKKEAAKLMDSAGYVLDWRALKQNRGTESFANVVVVKFHGKCKLEYPVAVASDDEVTVATTLVDAGRVLPFSDVQCDQLRKALPYAKQGDKQRALGLAMGRVVAHELYHLLANTTKHAGAGLEAASHDWVELISGAAAFREKDFQPTQH